MHDKNKTSAQVTGALGAVVYNKSIFTVSGEKIGLSFCCLGNVISL